VIEERRECEKLWRKAIEIDPDFRAPHVSLAAYAMQYDWDWKRAERELQTVLAAGPSASAEDMLSNLYLIQGRQAEADQHRRMSEDLDALTFALSPNSMTFLAMEGRMGEAREECLRIIARDPRAPRWQIKLDEFDALMTLAAVEAIAGHRDEALLILRPLEKNYQSGKFLMGDFAEVYAALGDEPNTVKWLERAMEAREGPVYYLRVSPVFAKMQDTPDFHRLKKRMNLDW
jgi:tetratricopeptide (TPR) repeat protein